MHAAQLGQIVVLVSHTRLKCGRLGAIFFALIGGQLAVQFSHKLRVLLEQRAVRGAKSVAEFLEIFLQRAEHTLQSGLIAQVAVQLLVHAVRIIGWGHGLVGAGIGHARPGIGTIAYTHAKFQCAKARTGGGLRLQKVFDLLINRDAFGPASRGVAAALNVAGEELDAGKQAAHPAHVAVAIAAHAVVHALEHEQLIAEWFQRLKDWLEGKVGAGLVWPIMFRDGAVGAEHHDQTLARSSGSCFTQARQAHQEWHRRAGDA